MEVRLVTESSRGFFFSLARISIAASLLTIAASLKKYPSGTQADDFHKIVSKTFFGLFVFTLTMA